MQTTLKIEACHSDDHTVMMGNGTVCQQKVINPWLDTKAVSLSISVTEFYKETTFPRCVQNQFTSMFQIKVKVKCTLVQALRLCTGRTTHRGSRGIALLFHDHGTRRGEGSASRAGRSLPPGKTRYPLYRRLGGPHSRSGQVRKISPPPEFDPRTVQPVDSRYTDWATRPTVCTRGSP